MPIGDYAMLDTCIQYMFVFHSTCYICDNRMITGSVRQLIEVENTYDLG